MLAPHHLEGHAAAELRVLGQHDPAHAALAQLVQHLVLEQLGGNEIGLGHRIGLGSGGGFLARALHDRRELIPRCWMWRTSHERASRSSARTNRMTSAGSPEDVRAI